MVRKVLQWTDDWWPTMIHAFDTDIAQEYGLLESILLNHIWYWVTKNRANEANYFDGKYWTYNSVKAFSLLFPYATPRQIRTALDHLRKEGILETGNYNDSAYNHTLWYTVTEKGESILRRSRAGLTHESNQRDMDGKTYYSSVDNTVDNTYKKLPLPKEAYELADLLHEKALANKPNRTISKSWRENWAKEFEKLHRINKRDWQHIKEVVIWCQSPDSWWWDKIYSANKIREKIDDLECQMAREDKKSEKAKVYDFRS